MNLKKVVCLGFSGSELEDSYWQLADGLLVKLGAKVQKELNE
jgi:hypothetical protein